MDPKLVKTVTKQCHFHLSYSPTRWWSKFDCIEQIAVDWAMIMPTLLERIIARSTPRHSSASALLHMLLANRRAKEDMIRLEMAAVIDGGSIFRNKTYFLEGDGALIFVASDTCLLYTSDAADE